MAASLAACGGSSHSTTSAIAAGGNTAVTGGVDPTAPPAATAAKAKSSAKQLSAGVIATVAGVPITLAQYQQAYDAQFRAMSSSGVPLDPPSYSRCAAALAQQFSKLQQQLASQKLKGSHAPKLATPSHATLVKQCQTRAAGIKQNVMTQLIQQQWLADEARAQGVSVSDATVNAAIARQAQALGGAAAYNRYLARTGQTRAKVASTMRLMLTEQALQQRRLGPAVSVSDAQVAAYFNAHKAEFMLPHQPAPKLSTYAARIKLLLQSQLRSRRSATATTDFERRWRAETVCAAGYVVPLCANAAR